MNVTNRRQPLACRGYSGNYKERDAAEVALAECWSELVRRRLIIFSMLVPND